MRWERTVSVVKHAVRPMPCEMCGKKGPMVLALIDNAELRVCRDCAELGTLVTREKKQLEKQVNMAAALEARAKRRQPRDVLKDTEWELVFNYGKVIMEARKQKGLSQEELGRKINERKAIIAKAEAQEFHPDKRLIAKLERFLGIELKESMVDLPRRSRAEEAAGLTLGDLIKMKKK